MKIFVSILIVALIVIFTFAQNTEIETIPVEHVVMPQVIVIKTTDDKIKKLDALIQKTNVSIIDVVHNAKDKKEIECLAKNVFHEARNQPTVGKVAVAYVVLTRVKDDETSVCKVVYKKHQFSWVGHVKKRKHNVIEDKAWTEALSIAYLAINNKVEDPTNGAAVYYNPKKAHPYWGRMMTRIKTAYSEDGYIGDHLFGNLN